MGKNGSWTVKEFLLRGEKVRIRVFTLCWKIVEIEPWQSFVDNTASYS